MLCYVILPSENVNDSSHLSLTIRENNSLQGLKLASKFQKKGLKKLLDCQKISYALSELCFQLTRSSWENGIPVFCLVQRKG